MCDPRARIGAAFEFIQEMWMAVGLSSVLGEKNLGEGKGSRESVEG